MTAKNKTDDRIDEMFDQIITVVRDVAKHATTLAEKANQDSSWCCEAKESFDRFEQGLDHDLREVHGLLTTAYNAHGSDHIKESLLIVAKYITPRGETK